MDTGTAWTIGVGAVAILILGIGGGFLPYCLAGRGTTEGRLQQRWWQLLLNCLAGGVLFGAGVLHLLPDLVLAASMLEIQGLPTPYLFLALGILIPTAIEQSDLQTLCQSKPSAQEPDPSGRRILGRDASASEEGLTLELSESGAAAQAAEDKPRDEPLGHAPPGHEHDAGLPSPPGLATAVLLSATLGVHSLLEGVGIGVQKELASSLGIVVAVVAHKGFAGFALGQLFLVSGATLCQAAPGIAVFGAATPVGILLGVVLNSVVTSPWVDVVAVGLACGTFIFVSLVEILIPALQTRHSIAASWRWVAFLVGVGAFAGIGYALEGSDV